MSVIGVIARAFVVAVVYCTAREGGEVGNYMSEVRVVTS